MSFKRYGARQLGEWIDNNVRQAKHLHSMVAKHQEFEAASEPPMSAICIRYRGAGLDESQSRAERKILVLDDGAERGRAGSVLIP
jgi:glutamate/tyrosine decarboxylase-like PLP-dependent enzyme